MKKYILPLLLTCLASSAHAFDVTVDHQLASQLNVSWRHLTEYSGRFVCYPSGKSDEGSDLGSENLSTNNVGTEEAIVKPWPIHSNTYDANIGSVDLAMSHNTVSEFNETYDLRLVDNVLRDASFERDSSDCVTRSFIWRTNSHRIAGTYSFNVRMPKNAWVLQLTIKSNGQGASLLTNADGKNSAIKLTGDLHRALVQVDRPFYIWGRPGEIVKIPIAVDIHSTNGEQGHLHININQPHLADGVDIYTKLRDLLKVGMNSDNSDDFMNVGGSIAGKPEVAKALVGQLGLQPLQMITSKLYDIAQGEMKTNADELHVKAMASVVDYEIALALLENLQVFCETKAVYLPMQNVTTHQPGFIVANFWMNQNIMRLQALNFPEVRAYLEELTRWQNDGRRYSDVANDSVAFKKMTDGFVKVRKNTQIAWDIYGDIKGSLKNITDTFGTVGTDQAVIADLFNQLDVLSAQRRSVNSDFQKIAFSFVKTNDSKISAAEVLEHLRQLEEGNAGLAEKMNATLKFVSINTDGVASDVLTTMTDLLAHEVNVFDEPLKSQFQEPVRLAFLQANHTAPLKAAFNQCLGLSVSGASK